MGTEQDKPPNTKRGRISRAAYEQAVGKMLMRTWNVLDTCDVLTQLDVVQHFCEVNPRRYPTPGFAVRELLDMAMDQVIQISLKSKDIPTQRIAYYLLWRMDNKSIAFIGESFSLSREYVTRTIGKRAIHLVTERVLQIGRRKLVDVVEEKTPEPIPIEQIRPRRTGFRKG
jgi:hypothetical protein